MSKYYAHINSKNILTDIDICRLYHDEYSSEDVQNIEVDEELYDNKQKYGIEYYIYKNGKVILNPNYTTIELSKKKKDLIEYNDTIRDKYLNNGIMYKGIRFDSDTDQKVNLIGRISTLNDIDNIVWYGMDNDELLCNKQDLINIGMIIEELHTYCWDRNSEIKLQINNAQTMEELESIDISYEFEGGEYNG